MKKIGLWKKLASWLLVFLVSAANSGRRVCGRNGSAEPIFLQIAILQKRKTLVMLKRKKTPILSMMRK